MKSAKTAIVIALGSLTMGAVYSTGALAQDTSQIIQRDINQQQRIEQGLRSGQLTVQEAAQLQGETARVDRLQARALADGRLTPEESARINRAQDRVAQDIRRESSDAQTGNPNSPSARRMQADVQRNINQDRRIAQGVQSGQLSNREVSRLERGEARIHRGEARAGADGHIGRYEQRGIQRSENREGRAIRHERHDAQSGTRQHGWTQADAGGGNRGNAGLHNGWNQGRGNPHRR